MKTCNDCPFFDGVICDWDGLKRNPDDEACEDACDNFSLYDEADVMFFTKGEQRHEES